MGIQVALCSESVRAGPVGYLTPSSSYLPTCLPLL